MTAPTFSQILQQIQNKEFVPPKMAITPKSNQAFKVEHPSTVQFAKSTQK